MIRRTPRTWREVISALSAEPKGAVARVPKGFLPHPSAAGMKESIGLPVGQTADFRLLLASGAGFHVQDHGTHYEAHIDEVHPDVDPFEHVRKDAPGTFIVGSAALGAMVGGAIGRKGEFALVGAALGALGGLLLAAVQEDSQPKG